MSSTFQIEQGAIAPAQNAPIAINPLEAWRLAQNLSAAQAAREIEVSRGHWYALVAGTSQPRQEQAKRIEAVTGVTRVMLMAWAEAQTVAAQTCGALP